MKKQRILSLGLVRIRASLTERLLRYTGSDHTLPIFIRCGLTERCNYRCRYCFHWRQDQYSDEMSLSEWQRALLSLKELVHPLVIQFVGGEPSIWPEFFELLDFCRAEDINWGMITNGSTLTRQNVRRIVAAAPTNIDISIDGSKSQVHDAARGIPGSLERLTCGIRLLSGERDRGGFRFPIRIKPTVHRLNVGNLVALVDWTKGVGATSIDFSPVRLWSEKEKEELWITSSDDLHSLQSQVAELISRKRRGEPIETSEAKLLGLVDHFEGRELNHGAVNCRAAMRDFLITANGDVSVCGCFPPIGNVRRESAKNIWQSAAAQAARRQSLQCRVYTTTSTATSCIAHRSLFQDAKRLTRLYFRELLTKDRAGSYEPPPAP